MRKVIVLLVVLCSIGQVISEIPMRAYKYRRNLQRQVNFIWGPGRSSAIFAAQIHAESRWVHNAESPYAKGLGQQTPNTEKWLNELDHELAVMGSGALNPLWSIRALVYYDKWLWNRTEGINETNHWAFILAGYNSGLGWVRKEAKAASESVGCDSKDYFCCVRDVCLRKDWACRETRNYVWNITFEYQPMYRTAGW